MNILLILIPITLLFVIAGGFAFFWAVNNDQFDDMATPSLLPMTDDPPPISAVADEPVLATADQPARPRS